jgi:DNA (cytosine-5)-methyltransferase 1
MKARGKQLGRRKAVREDSGAYKVDGAPSPRQLTCIDLFAGCGGLSLGLEEAGFRPLLFSEINKSAAETYIANRAGMNVIPVGDIYQLTDTNLELLKTHWRYMGIKEIDLVCGGPPCQGYSGIGHRRTFKLNKEDIPSNRLFQEMIRVIRVVRPRVFLFENVRGLLHSKWTPGGEKGEIFREVLEGFKGLSDYRVRWDLIHAKDFGIPQNRPRIIIIGFRHDTRPPWLSEENFVTCVEARSATEAGYLPPPDGEAPTMPQLLGDLEGCAQPSADDPGRYICAPKTKLQRWLRTKRDGRLLGTGSVVTEHVHSRHSAHVRAKFAHMILRKGEIPARFRTKKFSQRVLPRCWGAAGPNITATSLPDDHVHYKEPRSLTVREWARIQTFPDWYVFKGPRTTGGRRRAGDPSVGNWSREVPKYTQIGNAVPVRLASVIGKHLSRILKTR